MAHMASGHILDSTDLKPAVGVWESHLTRVVAWNTGRQPAVPRCPHPRSALEDTAVFALPGPTASCQQMTKPIKHAAGPLSPASLNDFWTHWSKFNILPHLLAGVSTNRGISNCDF